MADHSPRNPSPSDPQPIRLPEDLSRAALIRAAADAEGDAASRLGANERPDQEIAFERELREAVSRAMADPTSAPAGLRERILAGFDRETAAAAQNTGPIRLSEHKPNKPAAAGGRSLVSLLPRFAAIAAVLTLSATLVYLGTQQFSATNQPDHQSIEASAFPDQLRFVQKEHTRCTDTDAAAFASKIVATGVEEARVYAESQLGCGGVRLTKAIGYMQTAGYSFLGIGPCAVPGGGKSLHALFVPTEAASELFPVSLFLLESPGESCEDAKPGVCYSCPRSTADGKPAMLWRDGNLMVFVHSDSKNSIDSIRAAYAAPDTVQSL